MKKRYPTSFDVARKAGVSRSTVSLVLNDVQSVAISDGTRERVLKTASELKYVPHAAGRALASQKTMNIGFAYSESQGTHDFLLQFMQGLAMVAFKRNLRLLTDTYQDSGDSSAVLSLTRAKHIDGLVMTEPKIGDPVLHQLAEEGFPTVLIGSLPGEPLCSIDIDNASAAYDVTSHLISRGHRRIGCITNAPPWYTAASSRLEGYRRAMREHDLTDSDSLIRYGNYTAGSGYNAMLELLSTERLDLTAVFVASDTVAFGAMSAIHAAGLVIPDDFAIAGFDDIPLSAYASPPLTTVHFPAVEEGIRSAEILIELIEGRLVPGYHEKVDTEVIIRRSTGGE